MFYVPGLKHNLLSVGQLVLKGYGQHFKDRICEITDSTNTLIGKVNMTSNKMFPIKFDSDDFFSLTMSSKDVSLLWHNRFGHVNLISLTHMHKNEMVKGAVSTLDQICEGCTLGKHTRESFSHDKAGEHQSN